MGTVTNLAEFRARRQAGIEKQATALVKPRTLTKEAVARGVVGVYGGMLGAARHAGLNSAIRLICCIGVRAISKALKEEHLLIDSHARFQFFGLHAGEGFQLIGRVNLVCDPNSLAPPGARMFGFDAATQSAFGLSGVDNMPKNNTLTPLITLPASEFYNL